MPLDTLPNYDKALSQNCPVCPALAGKDCEGVRGPFPYHEARLLQAMEVEAFNGGTGHTATPDDFRRALLNTGRF